MRTHPSVGPQRDPVLHRQFVAGPRFASELTGWKQVPFSASLKVTCHPQLPVASQTEGRTVVLCLGDVFDPREARRDNAEIVAALAGASSDFAEFERASGDLSGRWLMFVTIGDQSRVYPDACGLKPLYYTDAARHPLWLASQPDLLSRFVGASRDDARIAAFHSAPCGASWPGYLTPYPDLFQLWPNHYIDVRAGRPVRFWPREPIQSESLDRGARQVIESLRGTFQAAMHRRRLYVPLTGGYDTRLLYAVTKPWHDRIEHFLVTFPGIASHDRSIPRRLAKLGGVRYRVIRAPPCERELEAIYRANMAGMYLDPGREFIASVLDIPEDVFIASGNAGEVGRCFYYKDGRPQARLGGATLADLAGYPRNPVATEVFQHWLAGTPSGIGDNVLDLFYWEHRLGAWLGPGFTGYDTVRDVLAPFNHRALLATMLGVPVEYRRSPHQLFRRICELTFPETLQLPFNTSLTTRAVARLEQVVPWRVVRAIRGARRWLSGFSAVPAP